MLTESVIVKPRSSFFYYTALFFHLKSLTSHYDFKTLVLNMHCHTHYGGNLSPK